jgi:hypothetical protein
MDNIKNVSIQLHVILLSLQIRLKKVLLLCHYTCLYCLQLNEPGGICVSNDRQRLYVADTNNHCIKVVYLKDKIIEKVTTSIFCINGGCGCLLVFSGSNMAQVVVKGNTAFGGGGGGQCFQLQDYSIRG